MGRSHQRIVPARIKDLMRDAYNRAHRSGAGWTRRGGADEWLNEFLDDLGCIGAAATRGVCAGGSDVNTPDINWRPIVGMAMGCGGAAVRGFHNSPRPPFGDPRAMALQAAGDCVWGALVGLWAAD